MTTVAIIVGAAAIALGLSTRLRIPAGVAGILVGIALSAARLPADEGLVRDSLLLSATFLVFSVGAEIDRRHGKPYRGRARVVTLLHLLLTMGVLAALAGLLDLDGWTVFYLVLAFSGSSTLLVLEVLRSRERFFEPTGRLVTTVALAQDLFTVVALSAVAHGVDDPLAILRALGVTAGLGVAAWACIRWLAPAVLIRGGLGEEERLLFSLAVLFAFAGASHLMGLPLVMGAYFAGMALSRFPEAGVVRSYIVSFSDFFTMVFFVTLGTVLVLPRPVDLLAEGVLIASILLVRPLLLVPLVRRIGLTVRSSIEGVSLLAQSGEVALVVALVGLERGHIDESVLGVVAVVVVVTMTLAPWLSSDRVALRLTHWYPFGRRAALPEIPQGHVLLLGCGEAGRVLLDRLSEEGHRVVVTDDDPAVVDDLRRAGVTALRGDGSDPELLEAAGAPRASAIISTMRRLDDNLRLLDRVQGRPVLVRVFSEAQGELVRNAGGRPVAEAEVAADAFVRWMRECGVAAA